LASPGFKTADFVGTVVALEGAAARDGPAETILDYPACYQPENAPLDGVLMPPIAEIRHPRKVCHGSDPDFVCLGG